MVKINEKAAKRAPQATRVRPAPRVYCNPVMPGGWKPEPSAMRLDTPDRVASDLAQRMKGVR